MSSPIHLRRAVVPLVLALALVATAACSKDKDEATAAAPAASTRYPLTGLPVNDPATASRPTLFVKIDNEPGAFPQVGLNDADLVYEEMVEGNYTRLLSVFQSRNADPLGPVRSVRPTDPSLVAPFGGLFGYSGGTDRFINLLRETPGITDVGVGNVPDAYPRRSIHSIPHNQYTSTQKLYDAGPPGIPAPPPFSPFLAPGEPFAPPGAAPATKVSVPFGGITASWDWDAGAGVWKRSHDGQPDVLEGGEPVTATTVIVQFVPYEPVPGATDTVGAQVVDAKLTGGTGEAWILAQGLVFKGQWSKPEMTSVIAYTDAAGQSVAIPPGRTWIELPPNGAPATTA
ncbi:MAG: DUF3048 domain-containing protein [Actinomycetota bacterium]|nr:DUF3048 domain-containing protein [Actinomycetota bacterium]